MTTKNKQIEVFLRQIPAAFLPGLHDAALAQIQTNLYEGSGRQGKIDVCYIPANTRSSHNMLLCFIDSYVAARQEQLKPEKLKSIYRDAAGIEYLVLDSTRAARINRCIPRQGAVICRDCKRACCDKFDMMWAVETATGSRGGHEGDTWTHLVEHQHYGCAVKHLERIHGKPIDPTC